MDNDKRSGFEEITPRETFVCHRCRTVGDGFIHCYMILQYGTVLLLHRVYKSARWYCEILIILYLKVLYVYIFSVCDTHANT